MGSIRAGRTQQMPADAAEISRDLLYHPARLIHGAGPEGSAVLFRAAQFTYRFDARANQWEVKREKNEEAAEAGKAVKNYKSARPSAAYRFAAAGTDDDGVLEIRRGEQAEPVARLVLWSRKRLAATWLAFQRQETPSLTEEALARDLEVADPEVAGVAEDSGALWLAIRYSAGEGSLGIGTIVRLELQTNEAKVYQPKELALSSVTHVVAAGGVLWLGTHRRGEGAIFPTQGLVRFDPMTGEVRSYLPDNSPLAGRIVTALAPPSGQRDALLVGTDAGFCRISLAAASAGQTARPPEKDDWTCWRIVPTVRLAAPLPVSNRSGVPAGGKLAAGTHEVRWANAAFLEVVTPDSIDGWISAEDFEEYERRRFDTDEYELGNPSTGGATVMRLLEKPGGDPLGGAQVYRAALEPVGAPTPQGWQRVRARVGWISRKGLEVMPVIRPIGRPAAQPADTPARPPRIDRGACALLSPRATRPRGSA